jgi:hypothetical protein
VEREDVERGEEEVEEVGMFGGRYGGGSCGEFLIGMFEGFGCVYGGGLGEVLLMDGLG